MMGVRICGMQVYHYHKSAFHHQDKYTGRKITQENIENHLEQFFFDGESINRKLIPLFLERVNNLLRIVEPLKGFRYYSSSLLFLYDGASTSKNIVEPKVNVTMIDFAHTYFDESKMEKKC